MPGYRGRFRCFDSKAWWNKLGKHCTSYCVTLYLDLKMSRCQIVNSSSSGVSFIERGVLNKRVAIPCTGGVLIFQGPLPESREHGPDRALKTKL